MCFLSIFSPHYKELKTSTSYLCLSFISCSADQLHQTAGHQTAWPPGSPARAASITTPIGCQVSFCVALSQAQWHCQQESGLHFLPKTVREMVCLSLFHSVFAPRFVVLCLTIQNLWWCLKMAFGWLSTLLTSGCTILPLNKKTN